MSIVDLKDVPVGGGDPSTAARSPSPASRGGLTEGGQIARATVIDVPMSGQRSLATVTAEIRVYQDAARRMMLSYSIEIGRRLVEAKDMVAYGEWQNYLREELGFSQSTANNHMRLFEAYGADQMTLDGAAVKSQAFAGLSYTQALELLALPSEEEREAFAETHDLAAMSTRDLREELRKRGEDSAADTEAKVEELAGRLPALQKEKEEAEARAKDLQSTMESLHRDAVDLMEKKNKAEDRAEEAEKKAKAAAADLAKAKAEMEKVKKAEADALEKLKAEKANPTVPKETLDKLRKEAEEAAEKRQKASQEDMEQAKAKLARAEEEADKARQEAERLEKELRMAEPKVAVFRDRFDTLQGDLFALIASIDELPEDKQPGARMGLRTVLQNGMNLLEVPEDG